MLGHRPKHRDDSLVYGSYIVLNQRWYYFPRMTPQETLIFKQYDTRQERSNMRTAFHGAINDPTTPEDAPLRQTIEVRLLALFDEDTDREARKARFLAEVPEAHADGKVSAWVDSCRGYKEQV